MASIFMSFLRPSPLPRPAFVRTFLRNLSTQDPYTPVQSPKDSTYTPAGAATKSTVSSQPLTYHVGRTPSQQLPVYHISKKGGNLQQTRIRKITGSIADLKADLQRDLDIEEGRIKINQLTKHIIIKGWKKHDVARFLRDRQF